ncbi:tail fiber protein [Bacteroides graminisolvens]|uniref:phage tail protein n=1 Tax=Bacteroides graminisolvens TaxID=477666 RepID=UPI0029C8611D|nr:tail fiber protein [Bacteroides graminisolvens]
MDAYIGEIRTFSGNYAPEGWHICDGTQLTIQGNEMLYSLIGTTFGGDGRTQFGLPDLRGRMAISQGTGTALTDRTLGQSGGNESVQLVTPDMPVHNHLVKVDTADGSVATPSTGTFLGKMISPEATVLGYLPGSSITPRSIELDNTSTIATTGGNVPHNNIMPSMAITYIICTTQGIYPTPG